MAVLTVCGEPGCRVDETARLVAQRLGFQLVTESTLRRLVEEEFGPENQLPDKAWPHVTESMLSRLATENHLVTSIPGAEMNLHRYPAVLRVRVVAPVSYRAGAMMVDQRLERPAAIERLKGLEREQREERRRKFGRTTTPPELYDLVMNAASLEPDAMADLLVAAAGIRALAEQGLMTAATDADIQFRVRLQLARHRVRPPGEVRLKRAVFSHPSEEIFANLLDFYRIAWEYEPRSFGLQWDPKGQVIEAFTPDFYLPEFDLYVELTTMKQALVTRKNRKIKLLRQIYPGVNIQIFYQKDFQNLIFKYGLTEPAVTV
jgi:cytidylate kinase